jgi:hypothetical protein
MGRERMEMHHPPGHILHLFFCDNSQLKPPDQNTVVQTNEEHHQAYRVSWSEAQSRFTHTSDVLIYRGDVPPLFIVDVGKSITLSFEPPKPTFFHRLDEVTHRVRGRVFRVG